MKKRVLALLMACAMLLAVTPEPAAAAETVYFTAVNERVLDLSDSTMPFWSGGYLYVPATVFAELGINYSHNTINQRAVLYAPGKALIFYLGQNDSVNEEGRPFAYYAIVRSGQVFVPVSPVSSYFGLTYSNNKVTHGYLIRVRNSDAVLSDTVFVDAAAYQLEARYAQYQKSLIPSEETTGGGQSVPVTQPVQPVDGKTVYLCLEVTDETAAKAWVTALKAYQVQATLYFTEEVLSHSGDLLREMASDGYGIGFVYASGRDSAQEQLDRMNRILFEAAGIKTRLVFLKSGDEAPVTEAGFCLLSPDLDRSSYGLTTVSGATTLLKRVTSHRGSAVVWLGEEVSAGGLRAFFSAAADAEDHCLALTETTRL